MGRITADGQRSLTLTAGASRAGHRGRLLRPALLLVTAAALAVPLTAPAYAATAHASGAGAVNRAGSARSARTAPLRAGSQRSVPLSTQARARALAASRTAAAADEAALAHAYAAGRHLPKADVGAVRRGSLHLARVPGSGIMWAIADFTPSASASAQVKAGFQDGAGAGVFSQAPGQSWRLVQATGEPYACASALSSAIRATWELPAAVCRVSASASDRAAKAAARTLASARVKARTKDSAGSIGQTIATIALGQVGVAVTPSETSFNYVDCDPYSTLVGPPAPNENGCGYTSSLGAENTNEAWCADFTKWVWEQAGVTADLNTLDAGATSFYAWGQQQGETLTVDATDPAVGDAFVVYPPGAVGGGDYADHVGIVVGVNSDGTVNLVNGDFLDGTNIQVEYDADIDLSTWAAQVWNAGEQWVFIAPPTSAQQPKPRASISGPKAAVVGTPVRFRATVSVTGGSISQYLWTFGNGATAAGASASHVFTNAGLQTVTMSATSSLGTVTTKTWNVDVVDTSSAAATTPNTSVWYSTELVDQSFFVTSSQGALEQEVWNGASWLDLWNPGQASAGASLAVLTYPETATSDLEPHVFFRSSGGTLAEVYDTSDGWQIQDLAGQPAADSTIAATTGADTGAAQASPEVFYVNTAGHLAETYEQGTTWVTTQLPGPAARGGALALTDSIVANQPVVHLIYARGAGALIMDSSAAGSWTTLPVAAGRFAETGSGLAALTAGVDGDQLQAFFTDRGGQLTEATSGNSGASWTARLLPGIPGAGSALVAAHYLDASGDPGEQVFYLASGAAAVTSSDAGAAWQSAALPGAATSITGSGDYPEPGQQQRVFLGDAAAVAADSASPGGAWSASTLPDTVATFDNVIELYAADAADYQSALTAASSAGLPASQVTDSFATAWADTLDGNHLVFAVGGPAISALYFNACGWANPSGEDPGTTPFSYDLGPVDQMPGADTFVNSAAATGSATEQLTADNAYYAVNGVLPTGVTVSSMPPAVGADDVCGGSPGS